MQTDLVAGHVGHHGKTIVDAVLILDAPARQGLRFVGLEVGQRPDPREAHARDPDSDPQFHEQLACPGSGAKDDAIRGVGLAIRYHRHAARVALPVEHLGVAQNVRATLHGQSHVGRDGYLRAE